MEQWKHINNELIDKKYIISNYGRIKNTETRFIYITKSSKHKNYIALLLKCNDGKSRRFLVHRLVAYTFIPNPNNYPIINHIDENKQNNRYDNLEWCTYKHNMKCWRENRKNKETGELI